MCVILQDRCWVYYYCYYCPSLSYHLQLFVSHGSLSGSKWHPITRTFLSILTDLNNGLYGIDSSYNFQFLHVFPSAWGQFQLLSRLPSCSTAVFSSLARSKYLSIFSFFKFLFGGPLLLLLLLVLQSSVRWWSFTGIWKTGTLLSILVNLNNAVVCMVLISPRISYFSIII